jgi:hypothetical protein
MYNAIGNDMELDINSPQQSSEGSGVTWQSRVPVVNPGAVMQSLRAAGLPLANSVDTEGEESSQSSLVCIAEVRENLIHALVACPTGLVYRFEPVEFEAFFWGFAARNYYWVTSSMADREWISKLTDVPLKSMKGKALSRSKDGLSKVPLNSILAALGCVQ